MSSEAHTGSGPPGRAMHVERAREAEAKARAYDLLALAFAPPSEELARAAAASRDEGRLVLPVVNAPSLALEHARLFIGPGRVPAPPWGSMYHEGGVLMGESTADVLRQYREAGFAFAPGQGELPDHVVAELSFLSLLAEEEARAWDVGDGAAALGWLQRRGAFLWDHLAAWGPELSRRILDATDEPFYRAAAVSLRELVAVDLEDVTDLVAPAANAPARGTSDRTSEASHGDP